TGESSSALSANSVRRADNAADARTSFRMRPDSSGIASLAPAICRMDSKRCRCLFQHNDGDTGRSSGLFWSIQVAPQCREPVLANGGVCLEAAAPARSVRREVQPQVRGRQLFCSTLGPFHQQQGTWVQIVAQPKLLELLGPVQAIEIQMHTHVGAECIDFK